jgi:NADH-quinone oxidoreductase subunit C
MISDQLKERPSVAALLERYGDETVSEGVLEHGQVTLFVDPSRIFEVCEFLKTSREFDRLSAITAVDWYPVEPRFELVYLLHSLARNERLCIKCRAGEQAEVESLVPLWAGADWYEREVFDLFGIRFRNHPGLCRIMLPENWEGHPLRRDFPTHGHKYDYSGE